MTKDDIIRMAREAGFKASVGKTDKDDKYHPDVNAIGRDVPVEWLERFAALVAAAEREVCAQMVMPLDESLADAIRARGEATLRGQA